MSNNIKTGNDFNNMISNSKDEDKEATSKLNEVALIDGEKTAIIAHITIIGWVTAMIMNKRSKTDFASFYTRQMLGLMILSVVLMFIPEIGWILSSTNTIFWILSIIGALKGVKKPTPLLGKYFQKWFKEL